MTSEQESPIILTPPNGLMATKIFLKYILFNLKGIIIIENDLSLGYSSLKSLETRGVHSRNDKIFAAISFPTRKLILFIKEHKGTVQVHVCHLCFMTLLQYPGYHLHFFWGAGGCPEKKTRLRSCIGEFTESGSY
jgi:hypothetical protein